jgi:aryl-phospho-beta-D-glucosidase BglC (GH1 family)
MKRQQSSVARPGWTWKRGVALGNIAWLAPIALAAAVTAAELRKPQILADFEDAQGIRLDSSQADAARIEAGAGHALRITTQADASWPSVLIRPPAGSWDLSGLEAVAADVRNPQDVPVRVLLAINNPGSDGRRHCSVGSVSVPPRGKAVLSVPFGMWHGNFGDPIDQKHVVSIQILLDRPGRAHTFEVDNVRAVDEGGDMEQVVAEPFFKQLAPVFGRGVNLGDALEAPKRGSWGVVLKEEYFEKIRAAGFDSVRIPVRWSDYAETTAPYRIDPAFFDRVDWTVNQVLKRRILAVVNIHHYEEIVAEPEEHRERFLALWQQIAEHYKDYPPALAFELLNEPCAKLTAPLWNRFLAEAIGVIRRSNPTRQIVVGPVGWNSIDELPGLELPEQDRRLVVTVHYYSPFHFTHQGASWAGPESQQWLGTKWTGTPAEKRAVTRDLDKAIAWAVEHRRPIYLGEFGAYSKGDMESRARWTHFVAEEALKRKMGFAYWEFCSGFGVYDPRAGQWIEPLKRALLESGVRGD